MNVVVVTTRVPFVRDNAEELCDRLIHHLHRRGDQAEAVRIPFSLEPAERVVEQMLMCRSLRLWNVDRVIALRFPAYLVAHPNKVVWLTQPDRPADMRGAQNQSAIRKADDLAFTEAHTIFVASSAMARRLRHHHGLESTVLAPPVNDPELFTGGESQGYIFMGHNVNAGNRQTLVVRALRYAPNVRLVIIGRPDTPHDAETLRRTIAHEGMENRVRLDLRSPTREEEAALLNRSLAVADVSRGEDSIGSITIEAFLAGKPVVTTSDSGGALDHVRHAESGLVARPTPASLGAALRRITRDPLRAAHMGALGRERLGVRDTTWRTTVERLLA